MKVDYKPMLPDDVIGLYFNGDNTFVPQDGSSSGIVIFNVNPSHVAKALGKNISVGYVVARASGAITSELLTLNVLPLMEGDMKMVKITQATESTPGALDLSTFAGDAEVVIDPWPFIAEDQPVWLDMISGSGPQPIMTAYPVTPAQVTKGITYPISRPLLEVIPDGSLLEFAAKVQLDGTEFETGAQPFPALKLLLQHNGGGSGDVIEDFETYATGDKSSPWETPNITFTGTKMNIDIARDNRVFEADIQRGVAELNLTLKAHYKRATVDLSVTGMGAAYFRCIYQDGKIDEKLVELPQRMTFEFVHDDISAFQAVAMYDSYPTHIHIDNVKLFV